jgi:hypothetical protein
MQRRGRITSGRALSCFARLKQQQEVLTEDRRAEFTDRSRTAPDGTHLGDNGIVADAFGVVSSALRAGPR